MSSSRPSFSNVIKWTYILYHINLLFLPDHCYAHWLLKKVTKFDFFLNNSTVGQSNRAVLIDCCLSWVHLLRWRTSTMVTSASRIRLNQTTIAHKLCKNWTIHSRHMFEIQHEIISLQSLLRHHQTSHCVNKSGDSILGLPYIRPPLHFDLYSSDQWVISRLRPDTGPVNAAALCSETNPVREDRLKTTQHFNILGQEESICGSL